MTLIKILIGIALLCCPPYGWLILFVWLALAGASSKKDKRAEGTERKSASTEAVPVSLVVKVENGGCSIYNASTGVYQRSFGTQIVQAAISGDTVAAVNQQGCVAIYSASSGAYRRSLGNQAVSVQVQGDDVAVTTQGGRVEIYSASSGAYRRSL